MTIQRFRSYYGCRFDAGGGVLAVRKPLKVLSIISLDVFAWAGGLGAAVSAGLGGSAMARIGRVRVPNPAKPPKGRLDAPPERAHRSKKRYRRRPKHPRRAAD